MSGGQSHDENGTKGKEGSRKSVGKKLDKSGSSTNGEQFCFSETAQLIILTQQDD